MEVSSHENNSFRKLLAQSNMQFDYEVNNVLFINDSEDAESQIYFYEKTEGTKNHEPIDYNKFWDSTEIDGDDHKGSKNVKKANFIKRLVSKKKRRFQNEFFDLDLSYITKRVIAMGFPTTGCESYLRNSANEMQNFFKMYHQEVKVYNLCLEKTRIYGKERFVDAKVGFFPFTDHEPCPIKLMLDFCVDICLYLIKNPYGVAAIHCKAGKGRTGVMCINYLIFSDLCKNSDEAIEYYAKMRTYNNKGVTISSQIRYIKYFETFLSTNLTKPYYKMIPKIMKYYINPNTQNMIKNYISDDSYFMTKNKFILQQLKIGPFKAEKNLKIKFSSLIHKLITFPNAQYKIESEVKQEMQEMQGKHGNFYFIMNFNSDYEINFDISLDVNAYKVKFYLWMNLWYTTLEIVSQYIYDNKLFITQGKIDEYVLNKSNKGHSILKKNKNIPMPIRFSNFNERPPTFIEMKDMLLDFEDIDEIEEKKFDYQNFCVRKNQSSVISEEFTEKMKRELENKISRDSSLHDLHNLHSLYPSKKKKKFEDSCDTLIELVESLKRDPDLNKLIEGINLKAKNIGIPLFNKNDINVKFSARELDKFSNAKHMLEDFGVEVKFKLI